MFTEIIYEFYTALVLMYRMRLRYHYRNLSLRLEVASPESDLDLLVEFETTYSLLHMIALKQDLEDLLGCPVDVVTEAALSPYIREQILAEAIRL